MTKTTVYLPRELKRALARTARRRGCSQAELVREGVRCVTAETDAPAPRLPLFRGEGRFAEARPGPTARRGRHRFAADYNRRGVARSRS